MDDPRDLFYVQSADPDLADFHKAVKTGCKLPTPAEQNRVPLFRSRFTAEELPPLIETTHDSAAVTKPWGMLGNDRYGDCFFAAMGHAELLWTSLTGTGREIDEATLVRDYLACNGGDNGTDPVQGLNWWKTNSLISPIVGYCRVSASDIQSVRHARQLFKVVILGTYLQKAWQGKKNWQGPTNGVPDSGPWAKGSWDASNDALHAVPLIDDDPTGFTLCTWGDATYHVSNQAILDYSIGIYVPISKLVLDSTGMTPGQKLSLDWLLYDAAVLSGGPLPPKPAPVVPPIVPPVVPPIVPPSPPVNPPKPPDSWEGFAKTVLAMGGHTVSMPAKAGDRGSWH